MIFDTRKLNIKALIDFGQRNRNDTVEIQAFDVGGGDRQHCIGLRYFQNGSKVLGVTITSTDARELADMLIESANEADLEDGVVITKTITEKPKAKSSLPILTIVSVGAEKIKAIGAIRSVVKNELYSLKNCKSIVDSVADGNKEIIILDTHVEVEYAIDRLSKYGVKANVF